LKDRINDDWVFNTIPEELTKKEVAFLLDLSPQTIGRLIDDGELAIKDEHIMKADLLEFIERHYIVNLPAFSVEENLTAFLREHDDLPAILTLGDLKFILNEIPQTLIDWPGYKPGKISKSSFLEYLKTYENIDFDTEKQQKTR